MSKMVNTIAALIFVFAMLAFTLFVSGFFAYHGIGLKGFIDIAKLPGYVNNFAEYRVHADYIFSHVFAFSLLLMGIAMMLCSIGIYKRDRYMRVLFLVVDTLLIALLFLILFITAGMSLFFVIANGVIIVILVANFVILLLKKYRSEFKTDVSAGALFWVTVPVLFICFLLPAYAIFTRNVVEKRYLSQVENTRQVVKGMNGEEVLKLCGNSHIKFFIYHDENGLNAVPINKGRVYKTYHFRYYPMVEEGKIESDPAFIKKLPDTVKALDNILGPPKYITWRYYFLSTDSFIVDPFIDITFRNNLVVRVMSDNFFQ